MKMSVQQVSDEQVRVIVECASILHDLEILASAVQFVQDMVRCGNGGVCSPAWFEGLRWIRGECFTGHCTGESYIGCNVTELLRAVQAVEMKANLPT